MDRVSFHEPDQEQSRDRRLAGLHGTLNEEGTSDGRSLQRALCKTGYGWALPPGCCCLVAKSCLTLCSPVDWSLSVSSTHGISQVRILAWVASFSSRESSRPRNWTCISCIGRWVLYPLSHQRNPQYDETKVKIKFKLRRKAPGSQFLLQDPLEKAQCNLILAGEWPLALHLPDGKVGTTVPYPPQLPPDPHWGTAPRTWNVLIGRQLHEGRCPEKKPTGKPLVPWVSWWAGSNKLKPHRSMHQGRVAFEQCVWHTSSHDRVVQVSRPEDQTLVQPQCRLSVNCRMSLSATVTLPITLTQLQRTEFVHLLNAQKHSRTEINYLTLQS